MNCLGRKMEEVVSLGGNWLLRTRSYTDKGKEVTPRLWRSVYFNSVRESPVVYVIFLQYLADIINDRSTYLCDMFFKFTDSWIPTGFLLQKLSMSLFYDSYILHTRSFTESLGTQSWHRQAGAQTGRRAVFCRTQNITIGNSKSSVCGFQTETQADERCVWYAREADTRHRRTHLEYYRPRL